MDSLTDENKYSITDSGWMMYETFTENLNTLNKSLPTSLFNKCWPILATKMSTVSRLLISHLNLNLFALYCFSFFSMIFC